MTLTVSFSKTLDALADAKAKGQVVYGMTRKEGAYKLDMSERPLSPAPAIKTPPAAPQARETANLGDGRGNPSRIAEQPESESAMKRAASPTKPLPSPEPRTSPSSPVGGATVEAVAAPVMEIFYCPFCTAELDPDGTCGICNRLAKVAENARLNRRDYALEKRYGKRI